MLIEKGQLPPWQRPPTVPCPRSLEELVVHRQRRDELGGEEGIQVFPPFPSRKEAYSVRHARLESELVGGAVEREGVGPAVFGESLDTECRVFFVLAVQGYHVHSRPFGGCVGRHNGFPLCG
jgi:hypothetical protein